MRRFAFDLDGTLCDTEGGRYAGSKPIQSRIDRVNRLFDEGHRIIIWTARGQGLKLSDRAKLFRMTRRQLSEWGLRYHELHPKPFAHVYVDDRAIHDSEFFE